MIKLVVAKTLFLQVILVMFDLELKFMQCATEEVFVQIHFWLNNAVSHFGWNCGQSDIKLNTLKLKIWWWWHKTAGVTFKPTRWFKWCKMEHLSAEIRIQWHETKHLPAETVVMVTQNRKPFGRNCGYGDIKSKTFWQKLWICCDHCGWNRGWSHLKVSHEFFK